MREFWERIPGEICTRRISKGLLVTVPLKKNEVLSSEKGLLGHEEGNQDRR